MNTLSNIFKHPFSTQRLFSTARKITNPPARVAVPHSGYAALSAIKDLKLSNVPTTLITHTPPPKDWGCDYQLLTGDSVLASYNNLEKIGTEIDKYNQKNPSDPITALHPKYGFQSENPQYHDLCDSLGITFIGPNRESMELGNKARLREALLQAGLAVNPGQALSGSEEQKLDQARAFMSKWGDAVVKIASGGGGRGIYFVSNPEDLSNILKSAESAGAATGESELLIESWRKHFRHLEAQALCSETQKHVVSWRDCSVQKNLQKRLEYTLPPELEPYRDELTLEVEQFLISNNYIGPGTIELAFMIDPKTKEPKDIKMINQSGDVVLKKWWWIEINVRTQVEKPVTELETGISLESLLIQNLILGQPLPESYLRENHVIHERLVLDRAHPLGYTHLTGLDTSQLPRSSSVRIAMNTPLSGDLDLQFGRLVTTYPINQKDPQASWEKTVDLAKEAHYKLQMWGPQFREESVVENFFDMGLDKNLKGGPKALEASNDVLGPPTTDLIDTIRPILGRQKKPAKLQEAVRQLATRVANPEKTLPGYVSKSNKTDKPGG
tara:strand:+ start:1018 stop:2685 length:1668 start_codon:yes stop_codon:yes gene_type:complete